MLFRSLFDEMKTGLKRAKDENNALLGKQLKDAVDQAVQNPKEDATMWNKVTIEADKGVDILTVKKVMYTVTEAGAGEINFAVSKKPNEPKTN